MALNPRYFVSLGLEDYLVDPDTGLPLSNGYIECYRDNQRATPKPVYQISGSPPNYTYESLPNPVQLSATGNPMNANGDIVKIYYYPWDSDLNLDLYYLKIYDADGVPKYEIQAIPNLTERDNPSFSTNVYENQLSNSQFSEVLFNPDFGIDINITEAVSNAEYPIAPDWTLVVSTNGAANISVNQVGIEGAVNAPTNPPFVLDFQSSGNVTLLQLRQRLEHNPDIWSTTTSAVGYLSGYMLVSSLDGLPHTISMYYSPSVAPSSQIIVTGSTGISGYKELSDYVELENGQNSENGFDGYVDIIIDIPKSAHIYLSSVQVIGLGAPVENISYSQEPVNRQVDHLFHYYKNPLEFKPLESYLIGWDFPLNPAQFYGRSTGMSTIGSNRSKYLWDQTIGFQSVDDSWGCTGGDQNEFLMRTSKSTQMAIAQYLPKNILFEIANNGCSVNINFTNINVPDNTRGTVSLYYCTDSSLPDINAGDSIIGSLNADGGVQSFNGNWVEIPMRSLNANKFYINNTVDYEGFDISLNDYAVSDLSDVIDNGTFFAIVLGFSEVVSDSSIGILSLSLVPGKIATRPSPKTEEQVLSDCQFYYERSYDVGTLTGAITTQSCIDARQNYLASSATGNATLYKSFFSINFKSQKIITSPHVEVYGVVSGAVAGTVTALITENNLYPLPHSGTNPTNITLTGSWGIYSIGSFGIKFYGTNQEIMYIDGSDPADLKYDGMILFHYTCDARLGTF